MTASQRKKLPTKLVRNQDPACTKYLKTLSIMDWLQQIKISLLHPFQKLKFYEVISDDKSGIQLTWESENICTSQSGPLLSLPNNPHHPSWSSFWWAWKDFDIDTGLHTQSIYSSIVRRIYCNPKGSVTGSSQVQGLSRNHFVPHGTKFKGKETHNTEQAPHKTASTA